MASLKDVAKLANVSLMTVSRALNTPERLKPETLANILRNELLPQEAGEDKPKFSLMNLLRAGSTGGDNHEK